MSIKRKLTMVMMGISLAAVLLTVTAITAYLIYDMRKGKVQELAVTAALTADRNSAALAFLDSDRVARNLEIFRLSPSILGACIYDRAGKLFAFYQGEGANSDCPAQAGDVPREPAGVLSAFEPVKMNGETAGSVFMTADTREIDAYVNKIALISFVVIVMVLTVILALTVYFQRTISAPILELAATAHSITAGGDYSLEAKATYADETGILARAFNDMLKEVRKRDDELMQANETLEQKVQVRTRELEDAKHKAEMASEAKSEFLRNMSHEFRTPLHAIVSFSSYGIKEFEGAERAQMKQYFELIQKGAERLSRLVNEVLDLAKLERGEHRFLLKRADMRDVLAKSAEMMRPLLEEKNIRLRFEQPDMPLPAVCDQDKIVQVITNLLGNAIKFTHVGRHITLHASAEEHEQVQIAVIDEGIGIPESEKEMIFESFRQSSRTNTGAGGTGLGLAICRGIIEAHGGKIWAENNLGDAGARVTFSIPANLKEGKRLVTMNLTEVKHEHAA